MYQGTTLRLIAQWKITALILQNEQSGFYILLLGFSCLVAAMIASTLADESPL
jgi:hypothetical protein